MGEVWRGTAEDGSPVAIKYMYVTGGAAEQEADLRRFKREITCQSSLVHPAIMPILGWDLAGTRPHFAMPIADRSLRDVLVASPSGMAEAEALRVFNGILDGVAYAHSEGVIHRDLKPENVLFLEGSAKLSDFGLGRRMFSGSTTLTTRNIGMGTFQYSAPEQFSDAHSADERADVFALGRILYEMFTGQMAVAGMDLNLIPKQYRFIIHKATQNDREKRFAAVTEMQRELALLGNNGASLMAPAERAAALIAQIAAGQADLIEELGRVLLENADDLQLFVRVVPSMPETVIAGLALNDVEQFLQIVQIFEAFTHGNFSFDYTDTLAVFLAAVYRSTDDFRIHEIVITRLLLLGYSYNRWFVRSRFVDVVRDALQQPHYAPMIASVLRENPQAVSFVKEELMHLSLPHVVQVELAA